MLPINRNPQHASQAHQQLVGNVIHSNNYNNYLNSATVLRKRRWKYAISFALIAWGLFLTTYVFLHTNSGDQRCYAQKFCPPTNYFMFFTGPLMLLIGTTMACYNFFMYGNMCGRQQGSDLEDGINHRQGSSSFRRAGNLIDRILQDRTGAARQSKPTRGERHVSESDKPPSYQECLLNNLNGSLIQSGARFLRRSSETLINPIVNRIRRVSSSMLSSTIEEQPPPVYSQLKFELNGLSIPQVVIEKTGATEGQILNPSLGQGVFENSELFNNNPHHVMQTQTTQQLKSVVPSEEQHSLTPTGLVFSLPYQEIYLM